LLEYGGSYGSAYLLRRGMFMPWELPEVLDGEIVRQGWQELQTLSRLDNTTSGLATPRTKVSALEMNWYMRNQLLRDSDWAGMAHSLEIRVPLVDVTLLRLLAPALAGANPPTKRALADTPVRKLPAEVLNRPKTGFQIPVHDWLGSGSSTLRPPPSGLQRGLRGWAQHVFLHFARN
jgi:asparagine synthase (glutamine-hydrolysing)